MSQKLTGWWGVLYEIPTVHSSGFLICITKYIVYIPQCSLSEALTIIYLISCSQDMTLFAARNLSAACER
jgi:hypothetical protein